MKKLLIYFLSMLPMQLFAQIQCYHSHVTCTELNDYSLRFYCEDCHSDIVLKEWPSAKDNPVILADPIIDVNADLHAIGHEMMVASAMGNFLEVCIIDEDTDKLLSFQKLYDKPTAALQLDLPWSPKSVNALMLSVVELTTADGLDQTTDTVWVATHFTYKPFHSVAALSVEEILRADSTGLSHPVNRVSFMVQNPDDEDIANEDVFLVYRSKYPDFSESVLVKSFSLDGFGNTQTIDGLKYGVYTVDDATAEGRYNTWFYDIDSIADSKGDHPAAYESSNLSSINKVILDGFYTHPSQPVYYCVTRSLVQSLWPEHSGTFTVVDSVNVSSQLPSVSNVEIIQDRNWSINKRSNIHITLNNPLPWEYNNLQDQELVKQELEKKGLNGRRYMWDKGATVIVRRFSPESEWDNGVDPAAAIFTVPGDQVRWNGEKGCFEVDLEDIQSLPYLHYYYRAIVSRSNSEFPVSNNNMAVTSSQDDANRCYSESAALIASFTATKEAYPGAVLLKWQLGTGQTDKLQILRREYSAGNVNEWQVLDGFDPSDKSFKDNTALSGHVYEYQLITSCSYRNVELADSSKVLGWGSFRTSVGGHLVMPNGTGVAGQTVKIVRTKPIYIPDVKDGQGNVIMPGFHDGVVASAPPRRQAQAQDEITENYTALFTDSVVTDASGRFTFENLLYMGDGTPYQIILPKLFNYGGKPVDRLDVSLNSENNIIADTRFILSDVATFSGRVLFSQSTVPVRDAFFVLNDRDTLCNAAGDRILTDANGKFTLTVPAGEKITLRVAKDGHVFDEGGYILLNGKREITPSVDDSPYEIRQINDNTRVRLVGRLVGGNVQASKPLGFGLSKNNLGDDPVLELQLDGDNTSWLVYKQDKPDDTTIRQTILHPYRGLYPNAELKTDVVYEKKRIVINPDPLTGEFFVDLIPATYKVSQLSTKGYATLYSKGEGLDIIDLEKNIEKKTMVSVTDPGMTFEYNASYIRNYHKAASVTYEQVEYGDALPYYGEGTIEKTNLLGQKKEFQLAWLDAESNKAAYLFDYPVFVSDNRYLLRARAHEDYYYNNDETNTLDEVPVEGGRLHVQNGLYSSTCNTSYNLDSQGSCIFAFYAGNPVFSLSDTAALRSMNISVELNGYYYEAEPLRGYVTGDRQLSVDIMPILSTESGISVVDVLRDPPGSESYAYREKGTTYTWEKDALTVNDHSLSIDIGGGASFKNEAVTTALGIGVATRTIEISMNAGVGIQQQIYSTRMRENGGYSMTLSERIETSSDPADVGAMADVYIGAIRNYQIYSTESFDVIDGETYDLLKSSIESNAVKMVSRNDDKRAYLVIGSRYVVADGIESTFAYSQKHIAGVIIPTMQSRIDELLLDGPYDTDELNQAYFDELAKSNNRNYYFRTSNGGHGCAYFGENGVDSVAFYENAVNSWKTAIYLNESDKITVYGSDGQLQKNLNKSYSVAGTSIDYSESASAYYNNASWDPGLSTNVGVGVGVGVSSTYKKKKDEDAGNGTGNTATDQNQNQDDDEEEELQWKDNPLYEENEEYKDHYNPLYGMDLDDPKPVPSAAPRRVQNANNGGNAAGGSNNSNNGKGSNSAIKLGGMQISLGMSYSYDKGTSSDFSYSKVSSTGYGYHINTNDNGYMTVNVYNQKTVSEKTLGISPDKLSFIQSDNSGFGSKDTDAAHAHNYVFRAMGGAGRNPWYEPDSTLYYTENGHALPLGERLLKIDNPRIYVDKSVVNNMPEDEKAVFQLRLTNETELNTGVQYMKPSNFTLRVDDRSNPNGAKIMMDGAPLTIGKTFELAPGSSLVKTIEVERGLNYDFENIQLVFSDQADCLSDVADISVHYLPVASPVHIASPEDKWTMNTLSAVDKDGRYYIPVTLDGFNVNSEGFHHIELQYKKQTDGESQWTKVCGYYTDEKLMAEATGDNYLIPSSGKINDIPFYGEKDPIEMAYNLRAVSFRKLGVGFVTRISNVLTGTKDTRNPRVFGQPKPANGILTYADVISIPFNEPIAYNYLDETANFQVTGYYNDSETEYNTALFFDGSADVPASRVSRNLTGVDFTIDAMVRLAGNGESEILSIADNSESAQNGTRYMKFSVGPDALYFQTNGYTYTSKTISNWDLSAGLNRIGMTFTQPDGEHTPDGQPQVKFYVNGRGIDLLSVTAGNERVKNPADPAYFVDCDASGMVSVGRGLKGNITDVRIWTRALPAYEMAQKRNQRVNASERGLIAHWAMNEGTGNVAFDDVNGADLYFTRQSWQSAAKQYSLHLDGDQIALRNVDEVGRFNSYDYTLSLWAQADKLDADSVTLFRTGEPTLGAEYMRLGTFGGNLVLDTRNDEVGSHRHVVAPVSAFADGNWHNIIVVANKSQNSGAMYFDGALTLSLSAEELAGTSATNVMLGDKAFHGRLDDITFWDHAFPSNSISTLNRRTPSGHEMGLLLNMPFEQTLANSQGTLETHFSALNMVYKPLENGGYAAFDTLFAANVMENAEMIARMSDHDNFCPLEPATGIRNLGFTWTATDNELQINLLAKDSKINHQNVNVVVRAVEDLAGNPMLNPQRLLLYVDKNVLKWDEKKISIDLPYGESVAIPARFSNVSGREIYYSLNEYASWISVDKSAGYISPLSEEDVVISIKSGLAPGEYTTVLYLTDDNELVSLLPVTVRINATEPAWTVTTDPDYKYQMNITGQVFLKNSVGTEYLDMDGRDVLYAFSDTVCVGKSNVQVSNDGSYVYMTVRGTSGMAGSDAVQATSLVFRLWSAKTGEITYFTPNYRNSANKEMTEIRFTRNSIIGSHSAPVHFAPSNLMAQQLNLKKGWNWVSFYIRPVTSKGIANLFETNLAFSANDMICTYSSADYAIMQSNNEWSSSLKDLSIVPSNVYQIYVNEDCTPVVHGEKLSGDDRRISINTVNGWNDLAYLGMVDKSVQLALADYTGKAQNGAVVMGRGQFAMFDNGKWYGSLESMKPGQGYYLYHVGNSRTTILYAEDESVPGMTSARKTRVARPEKAETEPTGNERQYAMPVVATLLSENELQEGDELVAMVGDEEVGRATLQVLPDGRKRFFVLVSSEIGADLTWSHQREGEIIATVRSKVNYSSMSIVGSVSNPLVIDLINEADGLRNVQYYTVDGVRANTEATGQKRVLVGEDGSKILK